MHTGKMDFPVIIVLSRIIMSHEPEKGDQMKLKKERKSPFGSEGIRRPTGCVWGILLYVSQLMRHERPVP